MTCERRRAVLTSESSSCDGCAELWYARADETVSDRDLARAREILSPDELERIGRFHFETDRRQFLLAHALVRMLLSRWAPVAPDAWVFTADGYGKPSVAAPREWRHLQFNLAHTRGLVACVVAPGRRVGVDVEARRPGTNLRRIADQFLTPQELRALDALPSAAQTGAFLDYWTLKEAYVKARGDGLSLPLDRFWFELDADDTPRIRFAATLEDVAAEWQFVRFRPSADHWMAAAVHAGSGPVVSLTCRQVAPAVLRGQEGSGD